MAYPAIPDAATAEIVVAKKKYTIQELPWHAVVGVTAEFGDILRSMILTAGKRGNLRELEWSTKTPKVDEAGQPVLDPKTNEPLEVIEYNIELITDVVISGVRELNTDAKIDFLPRLINEAIVDKDSVDLTDDFKHIRFVDMFSALKAVVSVNLENDLGKDIGNLVKSQVAEASATPEADGSTGSSTSTKASSTTSAPPPASPSAAATDKQPPVASAPKVSSSPQVTGPPT